MQRDPTYFSLPPQQRPVVIGESDTNVENGVTMEGRLQPSSVEEKSVSFG